MSRRLLYCKGQAAPTAPGRGVTISRHIIGIVLGTVASVVLPKSAHADTFGAGENTFEIPFVTIGSPGNPADTTGAPNPAGSVDYAYRIGKYEVPEEAIRTANALSALAGDPLNITLDNRGPQKPATSLSWFEAARFVNWLNEDQGFAPAYRFEEVFDNPRLPPRLEFALWELGDRGYDPENPFRNRRANYVLPSADEWYKAAFYDPTSGGYFRYATSQERRADSCRQWNDFWHGHPSSAARSWTGRHTPLAG